MWLPCFYMSQQNKKIPIKVMPTKIYTWSIGKNCKKSPLETIWEAQNELRAVPSFPQPAQASLRRCVPTLVKTFVANFHFLHFSRLLHWYLRSMRVA